KTFYVLTLSLNPNCQKIQIRARERAMRSILKPPFRTPKGAYSARSRKEVIQPQVPLRLPCYDFAPVIELAFDRCLLRRGWPTGFGRSRLPWRDGRCVQGPGTDSPWHS